MALSTSSTNWKINTFLNIHISISKSCNAKQVEIIGNVENENIKLKILKGENCT